MDLKKIETKKSKRKIIKNEHFGKMKPTDKQLESLIGEMVLVEINSHERLHLFCGILVKFKGSRIAFLSKDSSDRKNKICHFHRDGINSIFSFDEIKLRGHQNDSKKTFRFHAITNDGKMSDIFVKATSKYSAAVKIFEKTRFDGVDYIRKEPKGSNIPRFRGDIRVIKFKL